LLSGRVLIGGHGFWSGTVVDRDVGRQLARPGRRYGWGRVPNGIRDRLRFAVDLLLFGPRHHFREQSECTPPGQPHIPFMTFPPHPSPP
jgi:hypothetical protein